MQQQQASSRPVDLSPATTTVAFDPIIPPLRVPVPAKTEDDPLKGRWVLAFKDETSWRKAWLDSESKIASQCEMGAKMGCSISATNACRIPWWKSVLIFLKAAHLEEGDRERCEENEMRACMAAAEESCLKYARETCEPVFANLRIADPEQCLDARFTGPFRRKRWTGDMKDNASPSAENSTEDPESATNVKITPDYRERIMADKESARGHWGGPTWSEGVVESGSSSASESPIHGWEGGLIRPKVDPSSVRSENLQTSDTTKRSP